MDLCEKMKITSDSPKKAVVHGSVSATSSGPLDPTTSAVDRVCRFYFPLRIHIVFSDPLA